MGAAVAISSSCSGPPPQGACPPGTSRVKTPHTPCYIGTARIESIAAHDRSSRPCPLIIAAPPMRFALFSLALLAFSAAHAEPPVAMPAPPAIAAKSWLLYDFDSGQTLAAMKPLDRVEPASLTKLMTAYLVFSALQQKKLQVDQQVNISERATRTEGSRMFIEPKKPVTVDELLQGLVVQSGNDASIALAEAVAGTEEAFVDAMNREAQRLGMKNTHFVNSTGMPHAQHYSTAQDLALLAAAVIRDFPEHYALYSR